MSSGYVGAMVNGLLSLFFLWVVLIVLQIVAMCKVFTKAGKPWWSAIIPFYNVYTLYEITFGNGWYFLMLFLPLANVVMSIVSMVRLARLFGKSNGFAVGLVLLNFVFMLILGFGDSTFVAPESYDNKQVVTIAVVVFVGYILFRILTGLASCSVATSTMF